MDDSIIKTLKGPKGLVSLPEEGQLKKNTSRDFLEYPLLTIKDINSRLLNHWEKEGVIFDKRVDGKGWRKFSPVDTLWIKIVERLRKFGYPLEKIKKVQKIVFPMLKSSIEKFLITGVNSRLIISDNRIEIFEQGNLNNPFNYSEDFLAIDITKILTEVFPNASNNIEFNLNWDLNPKETEFLNMLRSGLFKSFHVETKNGEIKRISAEELIKNKRSFQELVKEYAFQDITYSIKNNKVVSCKRTISKK